MKFSGLTKKGRAYLAKCQAASTPIQFTKMKFGDGKLIDNENPADLTDIKNIKVEKSILSKESKGDAVVLTTIIDNVSLGQGYFPRETGIYVLDEGVEVLYFYMNDGDETSWIPPEADGPHRMEVKINLISSNTGSVIVHNDGKDLYITKEYLEANYTQKGEYNGTAQSIEDRVVAAVGKEDGKFPLTEAIQGNVYYFSGNKKFYICKETQNRRISVPNEKFEELSIYENRKKLENFSRLESERLYIPNATFVKVYKIAGMVTLIVDSGTAFFNKTNISIFTLPEKYRPNETLYFSASYRNSTKSNTFFLHSNGNLIKSEADDNAGAYYFTITYPAKTIN